eukprot:TRINITY_DN7812_c0_g1_i1.p1 TRINITY_DN7812_c0_g1~~TRINITY_DN7812_c0_g1_i1.p1  ORF type:complete len:209 (+),score=32.45 TRINITY_DN7812_c0_g1_i1:101-727(+)
MSTTPKQKKVREVIPGEKLQPARKARAAPTINYSSAGPSLSAIARAQKRESKSNKNKSSKNDSSDEDKVEQIDEELVRNKTLTIFTRNTFNGALYQIARKHAQKLVKEIEDRFMDESVSSSDEDDNNDDNASESSDISTYELPEEPTFPAFQIPNAGYESEIAEKVISEGSGKRKADSEFPKTAFEKALDKGSGEAYTPSKRRKVRPI